ncbi:MAG: zinc ribbon domain-containing protein [Clostridium sp.]|nr:zinc ribbon domain-containing protein [Clostridium sp.]
MKCWNCSAEIEDDSKFCLKCGKPLEKDKKTEEIRKCPKCGTEVDAESRFCNKCGWDFENDATQSRKCSRCGAVMEKDAKYCLKCGYSTLTRKNKLPIIIAIIVVLGIGISGTTFYLNQKAKQEAYEAELKAERERQELIHSYQSKAIELFDAINGAKTNFNLLSTMFATSTELNTGLLGPSFFTSYVEGLCSSELSAEKTRKRTIDELHESLKKIQCNETEVENLKGVVEDYYFSYSDRYDLLVNINFTVSNFSSKEKFSVSDFNAKYQDAQEIIKEIDRDELNNEIEDESESGGKTG